MGSQASASGLRLVLLAQECCPPPTPLLGAPLLSTLDLSRLPTSETCSSFSGPSRRGSNVSLTLDMCTPGCNEEGFGYLMSPREESAREYLLSASRVLQAEELHEKALDPFLLQAEFFVSPPEPATRSRQTLPLTSVTHPARQWSGVSISSPSVLGKLLPL